MLEAPYCEVSIGRTGMRSAPSLGDTRLATLPFLSAEERTALEDCPASRRFYKNGADLVREREAADNLYFLVEGWACQYMTVRDGRRQISALLVSGDICDLDALLFKLLDCGVRMLTAGTVLAVPRERLAALAGAHLGIAQGFTQLGLAENAILARRTLCLGRLSARERLAHFLCEVAVRLGFNEREGEISFNMPLTQEHLADVLGLTPVHVNRTMQQLRSERLLASTTRTIEIPDIAALRRVGEFQPDYLHTRITQMGSATDQRENGEGSMLRSSNGVR